MNKLLIALLVLGVGAFMIYLFGGNTDLLPENLDNNTGIETIEEAIKEEGKRTVYGSCNAISTSSNCIDYVGSFWKDNNMAELNCKGAGTFSKNTCPYSEFGGCQTSPGTIMEIIAWVYKEGPGEYNDESVPYARATCNELPTANWTMPDDLL